MLATEGLADFEQGQLKNKAILNQLKRTVNLQSGHGEPRNAEDRLVFNMTNFIQFSFENETEKLQNRVCEEYIRAFLQFFYS